MFLRVYVCLNPSAKYYRVLLLWLQPFTLTMEARKETRKRKTEKERVILNISTVTKMSSQEESTSTGTQETSSKLVNYTGQKITCYDISREHVVNFYELLDEPEPVVELLSGANNEEIIIKLELEEKEPLEPAIPMEVENNQESGSPLDDEEPMPLVTDVGPTSTQINPIKEQASVSSSTAPKDSVTRDTSLAPESNVVVTAMLLWPGQEKEPELEFKLKFVHYNQPEPSLRIIHPHQLTISSQPITRTFDVLIRRVNYPSHPIQYFNAEGQPQCSFQITSAATVMYGLVRFPNDGDVLHHGARVTVENATEIMVSFLAVSTYLTNDEKLRLNMRMHTSKHLEMLCLDPQNGTLLGSIRFQVVSVERPPVRNYLRHQELPISCLPKLLPRPPSNQATESASTSGESDCAPSDSEENLASRKAVLQNLQHILPLLPIRKLTLLVKIAEAMTE